MPSINRAGVVYNADIEREPGYVPPEEGEQPSAGSSSSASSEKRGKTGGKPQDTEKSTQSPARDAGSRSFPDHPATQKSSSSASSTGGSIRGTGSGRVHHPV